MAAQNIARAPRMVLTLAEVLYRATRQDVAQEMEGNEATVKQGQLRPSNQLLLSFPPFPVRHPV